MSMNPVTMQNNNQNIRKTREWSEEGAIQIATELICRRMEQMGVNRAELAVKLNVKPPHVTKILSGEHNMTLRTLGAIAWALDYEIKDADWLNDPRFDYSRIEIIQE